MVKAEDIEIKIEDRAFAVLKAVLDGTRRDYRQVAIDLGLQPGEIARCIIRSPTLMANPVEIRKLLEDLGVQPSELLRAAEAQGPEAETLVRNLDPQLFAEPTTQLPVSPWTELAKPFAAIAAAVLTQWIISFTFVSLAGHSALARLDWWQLMTQALLYTGIIVGLLLVLLALTRLSHRPRLASWRGVLALAALACSLGSSLGFARIQQVAIRNDLNAMFLDHRWVAYDPPEFNPYKGEERMPTAEEIERDLRILREQAGFDGLITFKAVGAMAQIPELARKVGFRKVIMGVFVVLDAEGNPDLAKLTEQTNAAVQAREWVDGYCLGHNAPTAIDIATLKKWMADLRARTGGKPVTTTAPLVSYLGERGRQLREIGDWYFPDVRGSWVYGVRPEKLMEELQQAVREVTTLPPDRPVLLKMISCPSGPEPYSPQAQAEFYRWLHRDLYLPSGVFLSYYSGFDLPWMSHDKRPTDWSPGQQYVGFFTADGLPRPSVAVVREGFPVQRRP